MVFMCCLLSNVLAHAGARQNKRELGYFFVHQFGGGNQQFEPFFRIHVAAKQTDD